MKTQNTLELYNEWKKEYLVHLLNIHNIIQIRTKYDINFEDLCLFVFKNSSKYTPL